MQPIIYNQPEIKYIVYRDPGWIQQSWLVTMLREAIIEFQERHESKIDNNDRWFLNVVKRCIMREERYSIKQKEVVEKIFNKIEEKPMVMASYEEGMMHVTINIDI